MLTTKFIGGSSAAAILGVSPWETPLSIYQQFKGELIKEPNDAMHFGIILEDVVAKEFERQSGLKVRRANEEKLHPKYNFIGGHIDRKIEGAPALLECKTTSGFAAKEWGEPDTDQIPDHYNIQVQHYMAVTGYTSAHVAVLIDGRKFQKYYVQYNNDLAEIIISECVKFWTQHIIPGIPPEPTNISDIERLYKSVNANSSPIEASEAVSLACEEYRAIKANIKTFEAKLEEKEAVIKGYLADNDTLLYRGKPIATWKESTSRRFDAKKFQEVNPELYKQFLNESTSRRFLVK